MMAVRMTEAGIETEIDSMGSVGDDLMTLRDMRTGLVPCYRLEVCMVMAKPQAYA